MKKYAYSLLLIAPFYALASLDTDTFPTRLSKNEMIQVIARMAAAEIVVSEAPAQEIDEQVIADVYSDPTIWGLFEVITQS